MGSELPNNIASLEYDVSHIRMLSKCVKLLGTDEEPENPADPKQEIFSREDRSKSLFVIRYSHNLTVKIYFFHNRVLQYRKL